MYFIQWVMGKGLLRETSSEKILKMPIKWENVDLQHLNTDYYSWTIWMANQIVFTSLIMYTMLQ